VLPGLRRLLQLRRLQLPHRDRHRLRTGRRLVTIVMDAPERVVAEEPLLLLIGGEQRAGVPERHPAQPAQEGVTVEIGPPLVGERHAAERLDAVRRTRELQVLFDERTLSWKL